MFNNPADSVTGLDILRGIFGGNKANAAPTTPTPTMYNAAIANPIIANAQAAVRSGTMAQSELEGLYNSYNVPYPARLNVNMEPISDWNNNGVNGGGGTTYKDTTASQEATQKSIDSLTGAESNGLGGIADAFERIMAQYKEEAELNKKTFDTQVTSNEQNRTNTLQASLLGAAQGGRGMNATLASLGALDGTGRVLANRAVASAANADIGQGNRTFDANATQLNNAWDSTAADQKKREEEATLAKTDEEAAVKQNVSKERQSLYEKMAGFKAEAGDKAGADNFTRMMGELAPMTINARPASAKYNPRNIKYEAQKLGSYLGGANDMTVKTAGGNSGGSLPALNSPLYSLTRKRDMELA